MLRGNTLQRLCLIFLLSLAAGAQQQADSSAKEIKPEAKPDRRTELNLLGKTDAQSGESRRNENVQFNLIDNNALKELNLRLGTTATIVEEFLPDRNYYGVEFGNRAAPPLHLAPSKLAGLHGSVYETHQNSVFSARSFFQAGGVKPAHENEYGIDFGLAAWRGAFLSLQGSQQKIRGSVNGNVLIPKLDERTPLATDPATRRTVERFLSAYPLVAPNRPDVNERALNTNSTQTINTNNAGTRLDQSLGAKDRLSFSYLFTAQQVNAFQLIAGQNPDTTTRSHTARITWVRVLGAATKIDVSAGFDRVGSLLVPEPHTIGPSVTFGSVIDPLGPSSTLPIDRAQNRFRYAGAVVHVSGRHTFSAGLEEARLQVNGRESSSNRGVIYFRDDFGRSAMTNFLLGTPSRFSTGIGELTRGFRSWESQYYGGDTWRVHPNLTLNYGLRYQPITGPTEVNHLTNVPFRCDCNNFAPLFGFAYRLPDWWGLLRGAFGVQYGGILPVTLQQLRWDPPNFLKIEVQAPNLVNPLAGADTSPATARTTIFVVPPDLVSPYSYQYNFSWELPARSRWKLQLGYVGSRTDKLLIMWYTNRPVDVPGIPLTTETINLRRPDPRHFEIRRVVNGSRAYFDAARVSLALPNWHGLTLDSAYWFSKAIDLGAAYTNTAAGDDAKQGRSQSEDPVAQDLKGPSAFDQSHSFLLRATWLLPGLAHQRLLDRLVGKWNVAAVVLAKTGTPFTVFSGSDGPGYGNVDGSPGDRPNLVDPSVLGRTIANPDTAQKLLPRSAFAFIKPGEQRGNVGVGTFRRAGIHNVNAAVSRTWALGSDKSLTFRAESINFFNTPQFAEPGSDLTSPNFGQITNTLNNGRTFLFTLRFRF